MEINKIKSYKKDLEEKKEFLEEEHYFEELKNRLEYGDEDD